MRFSENQYEFFDGFVASDGCITKNFNAKNYKTAGSFKHKEFAQYIIDSLNLNINICTRKIKDDRLIKGFTYANQFSSRRSELFTKEYNRWYPKGKKTIPENFRFSSTSMNIWYLGDGTKTSYGSCRNSIELCTQSFSKENLEETVVRYLNRQNIICWVNNAGKVFISAKSSENFLEYIGKCPVECYKYKWNIGELTLNMQPLDKDKLLNLYIDKKLSSREVGKILGCSKTKVLKYLKEYDVGVRGRR